MAQIRPYHWISQPDSSDVHIWGIDDNEDVSIIRVTGFYHRCVIVLPVSDINGKMIKWNKRNLESAQNAIQSVVSDMRWKLGSSDIVEMKSDAMFPLYNAYSRGKQRTIRIRFTDSKVMNILKTHLDRHALSMFGRMVLLKVFEPAVPHHVKLIHAIRTNPVRWLDIQSPMITGRKKICKDWVKEYTINWRKIKTLPHLDNVLSEPVTGYFDIETYSSGKKSAVSGQRPMPNYRKDEDVITMICTLCRKPKDKSFYVSAVVMGDPYDIDEILDPKINKIEITRVDNEKDMILGWFKVLDKQRVTRISGWNINGYDFDYVAKRLQRIVAREANFNDNNTDLIQGKYPIWKGVSLLKDGKAYLKPNEWAARSGAKGTNKFIADGIIGFDLFPVIKKGYALKSYTLNNASQHFLGKSKYPVSPEYMFETHEIVQAAKKSYDEHIGKRCDGDRIDRCRFCKKNHEARLRLTEVVKYCIVDCLLPEAIDRATSASLNAEATSEANYVTIDTVVNQGELQRLLSQLYKRCKELGIYMDERQKDTLKYEGGFVWDPDRGVWKCVVLDFGSMYPSIMITHLLDYVTLVEPATVSQLKNSDRKYKYIQTTFDVKNAKKEVVKTLTYDNYFLQDIDISKTVTPYILLDLSSRRKHINKVVIPELNEKKKTLIEEQRFLNLLIDIKAGKLDQDAITEMKDKADADGDNKGRYYECISAYPNIDSYMAQYEELYAVRDERAKELVVVGNNINSETIRQNQIKVSMNSVYGGTGAQDMFVYSCVEIASSVTRIGREDIHRVADRLVKNFAHVNTKVVYGDTDSVFVTNDEITKDVSRCYYWGHTYQQDISGYVIGQLDGNKKPHTTSHKGILEGVTTIAYEKGVIVILYAPKNYSAYFVRSEGFVKLDNVYDKTGTITGKKKCMLLKGVPPARRDHTPFENNLLLDIYEMTLDCSEYDGDWNVLFHKTVIHIVEYCKKFIAGEIPLDHFSVTKSVGSTDNFYVAKFANRLRAEEGQVISASDRLSYVVVKDSNASVTSDKMMLLSRAEEERPELDATYYFDKLVTQIDKHMQVVFPKQLASMEGFGYQPRGSPTEYGMDRLISILSKMHKDGLNLDEFVTSFEFNFYNLHRISEEKRLARAKAKEERLKARKAKAKKRETKKKDTGRSLVK